MLVASVIADGKQDDGAIEANLVQQRQIGGLGGDQHARRAIRHRQPGRGAGKPEDHRLGQELAQHPRAAGAERRAQRQFRLPADARASSRLATLTHATSSTNPTAPSSISSGAAPSPTIRSISAIDVSVSPSLVSGNVVCS